MSTSRLGAAPKPASADDEGFKRELVLLIPHLRAFARQGLITVGYGQITITDAQALRALVDRD